MLRGIPLGAIGGLALMLAGCLAVDRAMAIDIRCIEASRYKYLWQILENDREKFAEFLKVSASQLPKPEMCRAIVITGTIGPMAATITTHDIVRDFDTLLDVIAANNGWVAEIYLASPGGNVGTGMALGELARVFWLKTVAVDNGVFEYLPDFGALTIAPPGSAETATRSSELGWRAYSMATRGLSRVRLQSDQARCASACALLLVGGVDRRGITYVHRFRVAGEPPRTLEIPKVEGQVMALGLAFLQHMDAGEDMLRATQSTPANKGSPARAPRFPSEASELLTSQCDVNVDELEKQETHIRPALAKAAATGENREATERLRSELASLRRQRAEFEVCITIALERKRLTQFAKYCSGRSCDRRAVLDEIDRVFTGLTRPMAENGHASAQHDLGVMYANGQGVPQDYAEAARWYRLAADQGHASAQNNLGLCYAQGLGGLAKDDREAARLYKLAADQGNVLGQVALGVFYSQGRGGLTKDDREAARLYKVAADQGNA
jgi:TPR repeat protein